MPAQYHGTPRYALVRKLGQGANGVVFEVFDRERGELVALKQLGVIDPTSLYRFKQEFRILADIAHPNLVTLYELVVDHDTQFYTMELVRGPGFLQHVRPGTHWPVRAADTASGDPSSTASGSHPDELAGIITATSSDPLEPAAHDGSTLDTQATVDLGEAAPGTVADPSASAPESALADDSARAAFLQLARGVTALHDHGRLHRDIKPSNVLVEAGTGRVAICDFGLVAEFARAGQPLRHDSSGVRAPYACWGGRAGTVAFMSPEQAAGGQLGPASDWYAVGVMLYLALTGRLPLSGPVPWLLRAKQTVDPPAPHLVSPGVPVDLGELCHALLRRDPAARPTGDAVLARLGERRVTRRRRRAPTAPVVGRAAELSSLRAALSDTRTSSSGKPLRNSEEPQVQVGARTAAEFTGVNEQRKRSDNAADGARSISPRPGAVTVRVTGASGMGKTAVVSEFLRGLPAGAVVLAGRCFERESLAHKALDDLIDALADYLIENRSELGGVLSADAARALAQLFPALRRAPQVAELLAGTGDAAAGGDDPRDPHVVRSAGARALRAVLAHLARRAPVVAFIDDLQWGDSDSGALLAEVLAPPRSPPALFLAGFRSEGREASPFLRTFEERLLRAGGTMRELAIGPLSADDTRALVRSLGGRDARADRAPRRPDAPDGNENERASAAPPARGATDHAAAVIADAIARESRGSPFFAVELWRCRDAAPPRSHDDAPVSLAELIARRLEPVPREARQLLAIVALFGRPCRRSLAVHAAARAAGAASRSAGADAAPVPSEGATGALLALQAAQLVRTASSGQASEAERDPAIEVYHDRIRNAVIGALGDDEKRRTHRAIARALEAGVGADRGADSVTRRAAAAESLMIHWRGAGEPERAARYALRAARAAARSLAFDRAAELFRMTLAMGRFGARARCALERARADALAGGGRGAEAARAYLAAAAHAGRRGDPDGESERAGRDEPGGRHGDPAVAVVELERLAALQLLASGHTGEGGALLEEVLGALGMSIPRTPRTALARLLAHRARLRLRGLSFTRRGEDELDDRDRIRIDVCTTAGLGLNVIDPVRAAEFQARGLLLALDAGEPRRIARLLAHEAAHLSALGGSARARGATLLRAAAALARELDSDELRAMVRTVEGCSRFLAGAFAGGLVALRDARGLLRRRTDGATWPIDTVNAFSMWSLYHLGQLSELRAELPALEAEAAARGDLYAGANLGLIAPLVRLFDGDPAGARARLEALSELLPTAGFHVQHYHCLMAAALADFYEGRCDAAWQRIEAAWPTIRRSHILRVQHVRIALRHLRAAAALSAASATATASARRVARRLGRQLAGESAPHAAPLAALLDATAAVQRGAPEVARDALSRAIRGFGAADMALHAAIARSRYAQVTPDERGHRARQLGERFFRAQGVRDVSRVLAMYTPGFDRKE